MHGVKRLTAEKRLAKRKESEERAVAYRARSKIAFDRRAAGLHDQESLDAIAKVVLENTDLATSPLPSCTVARALRRSAETATYW